jgi:hypothetical protein
MNMRHPGAGAFGIVCLAISQSKVAGVSDVSACSSASDGSDHLNDGTSLLQLSKPDLGLFANEDRDSDPSSTASSLLNTDCVPSSQADTVNAALWIKAHYDANQSSILKSQGKLTENGLSDLAFTHIPKNAGDAVSLALSTLVKGSSLGNPLGNGPISAVARPDTCWLSQMPPQEIARLFPDLATRLFGGKEVFCVVRDPYHKVISGACHMLQYGIATAFSPSAAQVNAFLRRTLPVFRAGEYNLGTCFWIPQSDYTKGQYGCKKVIDFKNVDQEFHTLAKNHGYNLTLPAASETHSCGSHCSFSKSDLDSDVIELVKDIYREDFEQFGQAFGFEA